MKALKRFFKNFIAIVLCVSVLFFSVFNMPVKAVPIPMPVPYLPVDLGLIDSFVRLIGIGSGIYDNSNSYDLTNEYLRESGYNYQLDKNGLPVFYVNPNNAVDGALSGAIVIDGVDTGLSYEYTKGNEQLGQDDMIKIYSGLLQTLMVLNYASTPPEPPPDPDDEAGVSAGLRALSGVVAGGYLVSEILGFYAMGNNGVLDDNLEFRLDGLGGLRDNRGWKGQYTFSEDVNDGGMLSYQIVRKYFSDNSSNFALYGFEGKMGLYPSQLGTGSYVFGYLSDYGSNGVGKHLNLVNFNNGNLYASRLGTRWQQLFGENYSNERYIIQGISPYTDYFVYFNEQNYINANIPLFENLDYAYAWMATGDDRLAFNYEYPTTLDRVAMMSNLQAAINFENSQKTGIAKLLDGEVVLTPDVIDDLAHRINADMEQAIDNGIEIDNDYYRRMLDDIVDEIYPLLDRPPAYVGDPVSDPDPNAEPGTGTPGVPDTDPDGNPAVPGAIPGGVPGGWPGAIPGSMPDVAPGYDPGRPPDTETTASPAGLWGWLLYILTNMWAWLVNIGDNIANFFGSFWNTLGSTIVTFLQDIWLSITTYLRPIYERLTGVYEIVLSINEAVTGAVTGVSEWLTIDPVPIEGALNGVKNIGASIPIVQQFNSFGLILNGFPEVGNVYDYPVIMIQTPTILRNFYNQSHIILVDFEDYATTFLWVRGIIRASLYIGLFFTILTMFKARLHIG